jgi:hypothetical protein
VHARSTADAEAAIQALRRAITVSEGPAPAAAPVVLHRIGPSP